MGFCHVRVSTPPSQAGLLTDRESGKAWHPAYNCPDGVSGKNGPLSAPKRGRAVSRDERLPLVQIIYPRGKFLGESENDDEQH